MKQVKPCPFECNANDCKDCGAYTYSHHTQTNEEWFINLPTKEKAKALDLLMDGMSNLRFEIEEILNNGDFDMTPEEAVEMWLKQPHTRSDKNAE